MGAIVNYHRPAEDVVVSFVVRCEPERNLRLGRNGGCRWHSIRLSLWSGLMDSLTPAHLGVTAIHWWTGLNIDRPIMGVLGLAAADRSLAHLAANGRLLAPISSTNNSLSGHLGRGCQHDLRDLTPNQTNWEIAVGSLIGRPLASSGRFSGSRNHHPLVSFFYSVDEIITRWFDTLLSAFRFPSSPLFLDPFYFARFHPPLGGRDKLSRPPISNGRLAIRNDSRRFETILVWTPSPVFFDRFITWNGRCWGYHCYAVAGVTRGAFQM